LALVIFRILWLIAAGNKRKKTDQSVFFIY